MSARDGALLSVRELERRHRWRIAQRETERADIIVEVAEEIVSLDRGRPQTILIADGASPMVRAETRQQLVEMVEETIQGGLSLVPDADIADLERAAHPSLTVEVVPPVQAAEHAEGTGAARSFYLPGGPPAYLPPPETDGEAAAALMLAFEIPPPGYVIEHLAAERFISSVCGVATPEGFVDPTTVPQDAVEWVGDQERLVRAVRLLADAPLAPKPARKLASRLKAHHPSAAYVFSREYGQRLALIEMTRSEVLAWSRLLRRLGLAALALPRLEGRTDADFLLARAACLIDVDEAETAEALLARIEDPLLTQEAQFVRSLLLRRTGRLEEALDTLREGALSGSLRSVTTTADIASRLGRHGEARELFMQAQRLAPRSGVVLNASAQAYRRDGRWAKALQELRRAAELERWNLRHRVSLAVVARERGHLRLAREEIGLAVALDPSNTHALVTESDIALAQGDLAAARSAAEDALAIDDSAQARVALAVIGLAGEKPEPERVQHEIVEALEHGWRDPYLHAILGEVILRSGVKEVGSLREQARRVRRFAEGDVRALAIAEHLEAAAEADPGRRIDKLRAAVRTFPSNMRLRLELADVLSARGAHEAAERTLREALELDGENAFALRRLGVLLQATGRSEAAELLARAEGYGLPPAIDTAFPPLEWQQS